MGTATPTPGKGSRKRDAAKKETVVFAVLPYINLAHIIIERIQIKEKIK